MKILLFSTLFALGLSSGYLVAQNQSSSKLSAATAIELAIQQKGIEGAMNKFKEIKADTIRYVVREAELNNLGYKFLGNNSYKEALAVFGMMVEMFPNSSNAYDSYGEAFLWAGDKEKSKENYQLAIKKDPNNFNSKEMLDNMESTFTRLQEQKKHTYAPGQPTGVKSFYFGQTPPGMKPEIFAPGIISMALSKEYACTFSPDLKEFYFTKGGAPQLIMFSKLTDAGWTYPEPVGFSAGFSAHEPHVAFDNKRIFWGWFKAPPEGEPQMLQNYGIYMSERMGEKWSDARYVGQGMFVSSSRDGRMYLTEESLSEFTLVNGRIANSKPLVGMENIKKDYEGGAHPCIAPDGSYVVFDVEGGSHLFVSFKKADGTWSDAIDLAKHGFDRNAGIASISPDGKYLFFENKGDIYWVSTQVIRDLKPSGLN